MCTTQSASPSSTIGEKMRSLRVEPEVEEGAPRATPTQRMMGITPEVPEPEVPPVHLFQKVRRLTPAPAAPQARQRGVGRRIGPEDSAARSRTATSGRDSLRIR